MAVNITEYKTVDLETWNKTCLKYAEKVKQGEYTWDNIELRYQEISSEEPAGITKLVLKVPASKSRKNGKSHERFIVIAVCDDYNAMMSALEIFKGVYSEVIS